MRMRTRMLTALAAAVALGALATTAATAGPLSAIIQAVERHGPSAQAAPLHTVGYRRYHRYGGRYYARRRYYDDGYYYDRDYDRPRVRHYGRGHVDVDALYARVRRDRHGVHVRAPFVDLYIPRY